MCSKYQYETKKEAIKMGNKIAKRKKVMMAYKCTDCGFFHLSSHTDMRYKVNCRRSKRQRIASEKAE